MIRRDFVKSSLAVAALAAGNERLAASPRAAESAPFPKAPGLTKYVSEFIVNTKYGDIPADVLELGRKSILDGFGLAQWLRRERPGLKVILTSGAARTAKEAGDLCEHGPMLAKPYDHAELERHIRTLLAR